MNVHIEVAGGVSPIDNLYATSDGTATGAPYFFQHSNSDDDYVRTAVPSGDEVRFDDSSVAISFVFFRNSPSDFDDESVLIDDTAVPELNRVITSGLAVNDVALINGGLGFSETTSIAESVPSLEIFTAPTEISNINDATEFEFVLSERTDTFDVAESGSIISQSYTEDLSYFSQDYVADTVVNF